MNTSAKQPKRALILIDVQNEYVTGNLPIEYPDVRLSLDNIFLAADRAVSAGIPIVVVQQSAPPDAPVFAKGSAGWELLPGVAALPMAHYVEKSLPSALARTDLGDWLRQRGIDTLVVAGYMTQNCNDATIRQAVHEGWSVEYLHDASGAVAYANRSGRASAREIHDTCCVVLQSRYAAVLSTTEWLDAIETGRLPERDTLFGSNLAARMKADGIQATTGAGENHAHR